MPAHDLAVRRPDLSSRSDVLVHVQHVPGKTHEIMRPRSCLEQQRDNVVQCLPCLLREVVRLELIRGWIPSDLSRKRYELSRSNHRIAEALRLGPAFGMHDGATRSPLLVL